MKNFFFVMAALLLPLQLLAQFTISGQVTDAAQGEALAGANVVVEGGNAGAVTNAGGRYVLTGVPAGSHTLRVSFLGFGQAVRQITVTSDTQQDFSLRQSNLRTGEVVVSATRANERTGTTFTNVSREEIAERNFGQDLPYLLEQTPSVVVNSDAGAGVGYTGIRIRGSDITRINVTVNGIPINDAESHGAFFVNMPDLASSIQDIQVQRGVGTSTNGAGAFGASLNVRTLGLNAEAYGEAINTFGSYNTWRHTVSFGSGLINNRFTFDGRLSKVSSDGYIERASSDLRSYYFSAGYHGKAGMLKFLTFSGHEKTYQAWDGVPEDMLQENRRYNGIGGYTDAQGNRRFYDNETDNYQQDHYQLHYSRNFGSRLDVGGAFHFTRGRGYYEQYRERQRFSNYGMAPIVIDNTTIDRTDLIRRRWLDNYFYGATYGINYTGEDSRLTATLGGGLNRYDGDHFGEIVWARYASTTQIRDRYYDNNAVKTDFNIFGKVNYQVTERLGLFGDLQYRTIGYSINGIDNNRIDITQDVNYQFLNPKAGVTLALTDAQVLYGSFAVGNREPVRRDFTDRTLADRQQGVQPLPETMYNWEFGYRLRGDNLSVFSQTARYSIDANYYYMDYDNQLVLTGQLNDVGAPLRRNIKDSYRTGLELAGLLNFSDRVEVASNFALSRNKIRNYTETVYIYNEDYVPEGTVESAYAQTDISFSPAFVSTHRLEVQPLRGFKTALIYKTVSKQFLDNTGSEDRKIDGYQVVDLRLRYTVKPSFMREVELALLVNNILGELYEANGYTFSEQYVGDPVRYDYNYYYPQAPRNFLLSLGVKF